MISVHVISKKKILDFVKIHPNARSSILSWYNIVDNTDFGSFNELRSVFPSADQVGKFTVFNISGNNFRLIAAVHYNRAKVYIRHILTHVEYDRGKWKEE